MFIISRARGRWTKERAHRPRRTVVQVYMYGHCGIVASSSAPFTGYTVITDRRSVGMVTSGRSWCSLAPEGGGKEREVEDAIGMIKLHSRESCPRHHSPAAAPSVRPYRGPDSLSSLLTFDKQIVGGGEETILFVVPRRNDMPNLVDLLIYGC